MRRNLLLSFRGSPVSGGSFLGLGNDRKNSAGSLSKVALSGRALPSGPWNHFLAFLAQDPNFYF